MNRTLIAALSATFLLAGANLSHAADDRTKGTDSAPAMQHDAGKKSDTAAGEKGGMIAGEGEALAVLQAINKHEIAAAKLAKGKKVDGPVMQYAEMMEKEHTTNHDMTREIADAADVDIKDGKAAEMMKDKSKRELDKLEDLDGAAFQTAYVDAMVKDHTEALAKIDNELLPAATSPSVTKHLRDTRGHVAMHLEQAKKLDTQASAAR